MATDAVSRRLRSLTLGLLILAVAAPSGCGKRGSPKPPLPRGPHPAGDVAARQLGRRAVVGFVVPEPKGPEPSRDPVRAELVRVTYRPGMQPPPDPDAFRRRGDVVGQVVADPLPSGDRLILEDLRLGDLEGDPTGWTLRYAVRIRDRRGRSSPLVVAPDLEMLSSSPAPGEVAVEPTADGVRLSWVAPEGEGPLTYHVYRTVPDEPWPERPLNPEPIAATEYLDTQVAIDATYLYSVRVALSADAPFREGEPSESREIVARDLFAPRAPGGVVVVQEGIAVRLFWDPNPERDVSGYRVERSVDGGAWRTVEERTVTTPSWLDPNVSVGRRYAYRVVAVDRAEPENVSGPSEPVSLQVVAEPLAPGPPAP